MSFTLEAQEDTGGDVVWTLIWYGDELPTSEQILGAIAVVRQEKITPKRLDLSEFDGGHLFGLEMKMSK